MSKFASDVLDCVTSIIFYHLEVELMGHELLEYADIRMTQLGTYLLY
jgi:hypothetical protein